MSLEWARARALLNEARLRELAKSGDRNEWSEVTLVAPAMVTIWVEPADSRRANVRVDGELLHKSINRENLYE